MTNQTVKVTDIAALAAYKEGKFFTSTIIYTPRRELIKAANLLGELPPGVEVIDRQPRKKKADMAKPDDTLSPAAKLFAKAVAAKEAKDAQL